MVALGVTPRQGRPERKKDRVLLLRVPDEQRHEARRYLLACRSSASPLGCSRSRDDDIGDKSPAMNA